MLPSFLPLWGWWPQQSELIKGFLDLRYCSCYSQLPCNAPQVHHLLQSFTGPCRCLSGGGGSPSCGEAWSGGSVCGVSVPQGVLLHSQPLFFAWQAYFDVMTHTVTSKVKTRLTFLIFLSTKFSLLHMKDLNTAKFRRPQPSGASRNLLWSLFEGNTSVSFLPSLLLFPITIMGLPISYLICTRESCVQNPLRL